MYPYDNNPYSYNQYPTYQPYQIPTTGVSTSRSISQNQNAAQNNTFQWVQGQAGAEAYLVAPGASVILMDSNAPVIYFKSADQSGRYLPMKTYDLVERAPQVQGPNAVDAIDTSSFVKRDEISGLISKAIEDYLNTPGKKEV